MFNVALKSNKNYILTVYAVQQIKGELIFLFWNGEEWSWDYAYCFEPI
jgi:hypothetical protein